MSKSADDPEARLFMGTAVVGGHAEGEVTATGRDTAFGEIAELTTSVGEKKTHLQEVLDRARAAAGDRRDRRWRRWLPRPGSTPATGCTRCS